MIISEKNIFIFHNNSQLVINQHLKQIITNHKIDKNQPQAMNRFYGKKEDLPEIINLATTPSMLNPHYVIICYNYTELKDQKVIDLLEKCLSCCFLILIDGKNKIPTSLSNYYKKKKNISVQTGISKFNLAKLITEICKQTKVAIEKDAVNYLIEKFEHQLDCIDAEVEKLINFCWKEKHITLDKVMDIVESQNQSNIFQIISFLVNRDIKNYLQSVNQFLQNDSDFTVFISLLQKEFLKLLQYQELITIENQDTNAALKELNIYYYQENFKKTAKHFSLNQCKVILKQLFFIEGILKSESFSSNTFNATRYNKKCLHLLNKTIFEDIYT